MPVRLVSCEEASAVATARLRGQRMVHGGGGVIEEVSFERPQQPGAPVEFETTWFILHDSGKRVSWGFSFGVPVEDVLQWCAEEFGVQASEIRFWAEHTEGQQ